MFSATIEMLQRWGLAKTLYFYFVRFLEKVLRVDGIFSLIFVRPISPDMESPIPKQYRSKVLSEQELLAQCSENSELDLSTEHIAKAITRGDICVGVYNDRKLVSYLWRGFSITPHTEKISVKIGPKAFYSYKSFTLPEFRGQHLATSLDHCGVAELQARGRTHSVCFINSTNYASTRGTIRSGNYLLGYAGYLHIFGNTVFFHSPKVKKEGFEFILKENS